MMNPPRWLTFAQLLRLPNVFTSFADILMAACVVGITSERVVPLFLLVVSSGCLYLSGMVWNDIFDRREDAEFRRFRPIPSGRVQVTTALILATVLMILGIAVAIWAGSILNWSGTPWALIVLPIMVLLYDGFFKRNALGPIAMGTCRFLNVQLGFLIAGTEFGWEPLGLHLAGVIGLYIVGVTWFARTEEVQSQRWLLRLAAGVIVLSTILALLVPLHQETGQSPVFYPYLLVVWFVVIAMKLLPAIQAPSPKMVQAAVKRCIFGLVGLDAVLSTEFVGLYGLLIILLLLPAQWLGKRVYST